MLSIVDLNGKFTYFLETRLHPTLDHFLGCVKVWEERNLVDPASSHMLVSKIKPCMSQYKFIHDETAKGSLKQL